MISGRLSDPEVKAALARAQQAPEKYVLALIAVDVRPRSKAQNALYRRILQKLAQQLGGSVADWNEALVARFLGYEEVTTEDGDIRRVLPSTSTLSVSEFSDFLSASLAFAHEHQVHFA